jgi:hypothetical protein
LLCRKFACNFFAIPFIKIKKKMGKKNKYFERAISWAKRRGLSGIRANYEEYETPTAFSKSGEEEAYVPDLTAKKLGRKFYIDIALKTDNVKRKVSKWKLMETLAKVKGGKLYLLAPRGHKAFAERLIEKYNFSNVQLVYLKN